MCRTGVSSGTFMSRDARRRDPTPYLPVSTHAARSDLSKSYPTDQVRSRLVAARSQVHIEQLYDCDDIGNQRHEASITTMWLQPCRLLLRVSATGCRGSPGHRRRDWLRVSKHNPTFQGDSVPHASLRMIHAEVDPLAGAQSASLQPVLLASAVASMGAFSFGYHLGILNGPLAEMAAQLGFAGNPQLSGLVRVAVQPICCGSPAPISWYNQETSCSLAVYRRRQ